MSKQPFTVVACQDRAAFNFIYSNLVLFSSSLSRGQAPTKVRKMWRGIKRERRKLYVGSQTQIQIFTCLIFCEILRIFSLLFHFFKSKYTRSSKGKSLFRDLHKHLSERHLKHDEGPKHDNAEVTTLKGSENTGVILRNWLYFIYLSCFFYLKSLPEN